MSFLKDLPIPKRVPSRLWLLTLPSALISFEKRQGLPRLPGSLRLLGLPLIAGGLALAFLVKKPQEIEQFEQLEPLEPPSPLSRLAGKPATVGGVLVLGGLSLLLRSTALAVYSLGIAIAAGTDAVGVEEPRPRDLIGSVRD